MKKEDVLIFIGAIVFAVGFSSLLAHSAKQRKTAETQIIIMVDDSGKVIRQVTPEELRAHK